MDLETQLQEQLPQIRRVARLEDIRRVIPPKPQIPPIKEIRAPKRSRFAIRFLITAILFFGILGFQLFVIHRHAALNKQLYQISVKLKERIAVLQEKLHYTHKINNKLSDNRKRLIRNYFNLSAQSKILQFKIDNFRDISSAKSAKVDLLEGDLRITYTKAEALKVQNEVLAKELENRDTYIRELTAKLINNIGEQELLINENLRLKGEVETMKQVMEAENVNQ